ncbi:MAG TPA: hypothetical protein VED40_11940 [Azospirillaceae bacterium]|nr:hypothetical protein [Azospirillaceae bacterium]
MRTGALAGLTALLLAGTAMAQQGGPIRLGPPPSANAAVQPVEPAPLPPPAAASPDQPTVERQPLPDAPPPAAPGTRRPSGLEVQELGALSAEGAGPLSPNDSGFGTNLWAGTPRPLVEQLLPLVPGRSTSAATRDLARRLLLSGGAVPQGDKGKRNLAGLRLERVALMGDAAAANALVAAAEPALEDEDAARAWMDVNLLAGDRDAACGKVAGLLGRFQHPEWQMYQVVCQVQAGQAANIGLGIDLLREQGVKDDLFFRLAEATAAGQKQPVKGVTDLTPTQLALIRASGRGLPPEAKVDDPAELAALALAAETPLAVRLPAAERAAAYGALPARELATIYKAVKANPAELTDAAVASDPRKAGQARGLLYQAMTAEQDPAAKAALVARAMALSDASSLSGAYGELLAQEVAVLPPGGTLGSFAPAAARLLLLQGRPDLARGWVEQAQRDAAGWDRLWPLAVLGGLARPTEIDIGAWLDRLDVANNADSRAAAGSVLALLAASGEPVDANARARLIGGPGIRGTVPDVTVWQRLGEAGEARRAGEAALLALALLGENGTASALTTAHAVQALSAAGLRDPARRLALEAAAARLPM